MNHTYRLVWNDQAQRQVPAPESARACGKGGHGKPRLKLVALLLGAVLAQSAFAQPPAATTLPSGGQVVAGQAGITQSGSRMTITQGSDKAIINWQSFDIGSQAGVSFVQPSTSAVALNRVIAGDASKIYGQLSANGQIWLINPNGVIFGAGSKVDVGGLVASTLATTDADFLAGKAVFNRNGTTGSIVNQGEITTTDGGLVALLAPTVKNEGIIRAQLGNVVLAAGEKITLEAGADGLLHVAVDPATVRALVDNKQLIVADGGQVIMTAKAADALAGAVVANRGSVQAQTLAEKEGRILLLADMDHGEVIHGGRLDASAPTSGNGGFIETSAAKVTLEAGRQVTTAAAHGRTGTWLIDPNDYTIAASGGDTTGSQLSSDLASTNVVIQSSSGATAGNGDINVNDAVSWSSNTLTLTAARDININAVMTASGSSRLVMNTGTANGSDGAVADGTVRVGFAPGEANGFAGRVDFPGRSGTGFLTINGHDYTVINSLGAEGSTTSTDLQGMQGNLGGYYALGSNIDASATSAWNGGSGFAPIGNTSPNFTGTFDGLGHVVNGLTINRPSTDYVGLFGYTNFTASLRNIGLQGGSVAGYDYVGELVGSNQGTISNVYATGSVSGSSSVGGLVGKNMSYCYVGWGCSISSAYATGNVTGNSSVGGLVGNNAHSINNAYATGNVTGNAEVGGLVGFNSTGGSTLSNAYATGSVTGNVDVGGLVGSSPYSICSNSFYNVDQVSINGTHLMTLGGIFDSQYQAWQSGGRLPLNPANYLATNANGEYLLANVLDIRNALPFIYDAANKFRLTADIDLTGHAGLYLPALAGQLDGAGHVVRHLDLGGYSSISNVGWVGYLAGSLTNLGVVDVVVHGNNGVGGLVGTNWGAISNAYGSGSVTGNEGVGGLVGLSIGTISNAYSTASVTGGSYIGGLVGEDLVGTSNTYATGSVAGTSDVGGLAGYNDGTSTNNFWNTETTGQSASAGGIGLNSVQMQQQASFAGWDFTNTWRIYEGQSYPVLRVFQKDLTVTANNAGKTYDSAAYSGGNGVTQSTANALTGAVTYGGTSQGATNAGSYTISPSVAMTQQDYQNWNVSYVDGTLSINPVVLTTTITGSLTGTVQKTYDAGTAATLSAGNFLLTGWVGSDGATVTKTAGSYDNANAGSGKTVTVTLANSDYSASGSTDLANYVLPASISGNVGVIDKATLTVTANDAGKTYDGNAWSGGNGVAYAGFVAGQNASALSGALAYGGNSQGAVDAGSYTITPSGLASDNYAISFTSGTLIVEPAAVSTQITPPSSGEVWRSKQSPELVPLPPAQRPTSDLTAEQAGRGGMLFLTLAPKFIRIGD